jgi:hypothetical protein
MDEENAEVVSLPQAPDAIELRHLRAFVAVAEELNFGRAAARLYLSQPALSRQIRSLERLVGCDLLRRSTHRVELTLAGEALLDRARGLLRDVDEAVSATRSVGGELLARIARHWATFAVVNPADLQDLRVAYEGLHGQFEPPPGISVRSVNAGEYPDSCSRPSRANPPRCCTCTAAGTSPGRRSARSVTAMASPAKSRRRPGQQTSMPRPTRGRTHGGAPGRSGPCRAAGVRHLSRYCGRTGTRKCSRLRCGPGPCYLSRSFLPTGLTVAAEAIWILIQRRVGWPRREMPTGHSVHAARALRVGGRCRAPHVVRCAGLARQPS